MAVTLAMSSVSGMTVFAADAVVDDSSSSSDTGSSDSTTSNSSSDSVSSDSTDSNSSSDDGDTSASNDDATDDDDAATTDADAVTDTTSQGDDVVDTAAAVSLYSLDDTDSDDTSDNADASNDAAPASDNSDQVAPAAAQQQQEAKVFLRDNSYDTSSNYDDRDNIVIELSDDDELSRIVTIHLDGAKFTDANGDTTKPILLGDDLSSWCHTLPDGLRMVKALSDNNGAPWARVKFEGRTSVGGNHTITLTIPANRLQAVVSQGYTVSEDGLSVTFTINVDGVNIPVTMPVSSSSKHKHSSSTPQVEEIDYVKFCNEVAEQIKGAEQNGVVTVETDKWVSFNQTVVEALDARSDVSLTLDFVYDEKEYQTIISAGTVREIVTTEVQAELADPFDIPTPLAAMPSFVNSEENKYFGFMYVGSVFGLNNVTE